MAITAAAPSAGRATRARIGRSIDRWLLPIYVVGVTAYLILPVAVMILFSFNDPTGRSNLNWREFSIAAWLNPLGRAGLSDAVRNSVVVALVSTVVATILIAHIMFNISYVVVTVKARLANFPRHLEEAAMDLGANEWTTFWKVTFPLILPGVIAAALLAFSLSIDDFVITAFTSGQTQTFPIYIYGSQLRGIPVQVNVIGTIIFVTAVTLVLVTTLWQRRVAARDYAGSTV
jgi:spermidine/putrescine transport system permease protein